MLFGTGSKQAEYEQAFDPNIHRPIHALWRPVKLRVAVLRSAYTVPLTIL